MAVSVDSAVAVSVARRWRFPWVPSLPSLSGGRNSLDRLSRRCRHNMRNYPILWIGLADEHQEECRHDERTPNPNRTLVSNPSVCLFAVTNYYVN